MGLQATHHVNRNICAVQVAPRQPPRCLRIRNTLAAHRAASTAPECAAAAKDIVASLRQQVPCKWLVEGGEAFEFELAGIIEGLEAVTPVTYPVDHPDRALDELNELVARLLDWADSRELKLTD